MSYPAWSILIPTLACRRDRFKGLLDVLLPQVDEYSAIEVLALHNEGGPIGAIRQSLLKASRGSYVSFIDDDDMVTEDFVSLVMDGIKAEPDVVSFDVNYYVNGGFVARVHNSIEFEPRDAPDGFYRDLTHVQPLKRELALLGSFEDGWPEDNAWRRQVRPHVKTEYRIDKPLYEYRYAVHDSVQHGTQLKPGPQPPRLPVFSPSFWYLLAP